MDILIDSSFTWVKLFLIERKKKSPLSNGSLDQIRSTYC